MLFIPANHFDPHFFSFEILSFENMEPSHKSLTLLITILEERQALEGEIVCKCLARNEQQVPFFHFNLMYCTSALFAIRLYDFKFSLINYFSPSLIMGSVPLLSIATTK